MTKFRTIVLSIITIATLGVLLKKDDIYQIYAFEKHNKEYKEVIRLTNNLLQDVKKLDRNNAVEKRRLTEQAKQYHSEGMLVGTIVLAASTGKDVCPLLDESISNMSTDALIETQMLNPDGKTLTEVFVQSNCEDFRDKWITIAQNAYTSESNVLHKTRLKQVEIREQSSEAKTQ